MGNSKDYQMGVFVGRKLPQDMSDQEIKQEKRATMKNIILISIVFLCTFTSIQGLLRLQSSLHIKAGMGVINSSVLYGAFSLSCLFVPQFLISLIGHKWTIPLSLCGYILWMAANGYAVWATMVPASILGGICAAALWIAQSSYFTILATRYAKILREEKDAVVTKFFGIFFFFFHISNTTGSIISFKMLEPKVVNNSVEETIGDAALKYCGMNDCPGNPINETKLEIPAHHVVWTMLGVYIAITVFAVLLAVFAVDQLPHDLIVTQPTATGRLQLLAATTRKMRQKEQLLIIPIIIYSTFNQASYNAEFTKSFVSCPVGIWKVGLFTIAYGVCGSISSFTVGQVVKYTGRIPIFTFGMVIDISKQVTLMQWMPDPSKEYVLFILSSVWGLTDAIWRTQISALVGSLSPTESEAAFSNYNIWKSLGFIIGFAISAYLCTSYKIYILTGLLLLGMTGYYTLEIVIHVTKSGGHATGTDEARDIEETCV